MQLSQSTKQISRSKISLNAGGLAGWMLGLLRAARREHKSTVRQMHLLETLSLGGKKQLMLVDCAGERFLVGGGLESVETIVRVQAEGSPDLAAKKLDRTCF
jgi:flagellar biogenesis protein FliO